MKTSGIFLVEIVPFFAGFGTLFGIKRLKNFKILKKTRKRSDYRLRKSKIISGSFQNLKILENFSKKSSNFRPNINFFFIKSLKKTPKSLIIQ
jgi:hypothetical protein